MFLEESMDILAALKQEEVKLQRQWKGIQGAILALSGSQAASVSSKLVSPNGVSRKRAMSAAGRARISKLTKERWAKFRAEKAKREKKQNKIFLQNKITGAAGIIFSLTPSDASRTRKSGSHGPNSVQGNPSRCAVTVGS